MHKRLQGNGSVTIPVKIRRGLGIEPYAALDVQPQENGDILIKRYNPKCVFCGSEENNVVYKNVSMCQECRNKLTKEGTE